MAGHTSKTLRKRLGVAEFTAWTDLCAAPDGIPRRVRPFNSRMIAHLDPISPVSVTGLVRRYKGDVRRFACRVAGAHDLESRCWMRSIRLVSRTRPEGRTLCVSRLSSPTAKPSSATCRGPVDPSAKQEKNVFPLIRWDPFNAAAAHSLLRHYSCAHARTSSAWTPSWMNVDV